MIGSYWSSIPLLGYMDSLMRLISDLNSSLQGIFSLALVTQKQIVENENFIIFRKASKIKFPWVIGPFMVKRKVAFPVI